jgi:hypothetical protein
MTVPEAIKAAEEISPGHAAPDGAEDAQSQAIIKIGHFVEKEPDDLAVRIEVDLRTAIATCLLLEHLLTSFFRGSRLLRDPTFCLEGRQYNAGNLVKPRRRPVRRDLTDCCTSLANPPVGELNRSGPRFVNYVEGRFRSSPKTREPSRSHNFPDARFAGLRSQAESHFLRP